VRLIFCGTPQFAVPTLDALHAAGHEIALVVTQPDKPRGRGMEVQFSPIKQKARDLSLPVTQPEKIKKNDDFRAQLERIKPEVIIVVAYGRIIPEWMLSLPEHGNINLHASLLPKYRGAAPIQWAIANGETVSGNTSMRLDAGLDTGGILLQQEIPIAPDDTSLTYATKLAGEGATLMVETLRGLEKRIITARKQDDSQATLAPILHKDDGRVDFKRTAQEIYNRLRGFQPWPGAWTTFRAKQLTIIAARPTRETLPGAPGTVAVTSAGVHVACGAETSLELVEVQPEGKKRMPVRDWANGYSPDGERLG
jgi:methionyl-tRNA formyltransferase